MKKIIFISIAAIIGFSACGQKLKKEDVPSVVTAKFKTLYPIIEDVNWSKENNIYEAEFDLNKVETSASFDVKGNLVETETEIAVANLPATITKYLEKNLPGEKIKEASKITDSKGVITFEAEVNNVDYVFDKDGNFIKEVKEKQ